MMIEKIYSEEFEQKVLHSDKPVIVDFFADWCGPCKMLSPVLEALASKNNDIDFYKINVDENTDLAEKYSVSSIPNVLIFKNGQVADNSIGFKTEEQMQEFINSNR